jgi:hypothetical protein
VSRGEPDDFIVLDPCPDSVWEQLPGGPIASDDDRFGEVWQYMGTFRAEDHVVHEFRHRAHPGFGHARVYAHVLDNDAGPHLDRLTADGQELPLPDECPESSEKDQQ